MFRPFLLGVLKKDRSTKTWNSAIEMMSAHCATVVQNRRDSVWLAVSKLRWAVPSHS